MLVLRSGERYAQAMHGRLTLESGQRLAIDGALPRICRRAITIFMPATRRRTAMPAAADHCQSGAMFSAGRFKAVGLGGATCTPHAAERAGGLAISPTWHGWAHGRGRSAPECWSSIHWMPSPRLAARTSPYFPSSRRFLNPLYLLIDEVPDYGAAQGELAPVEKSPALNVTR